MPEIKPVTIPVDDPTIALMLLLVQVPPEGVEFKVVVNPTQTSGVPVIIDGLGLIVITVLSKQPVGKA